MIGITALVTGVIHYIFFPTIGSCGSSGVVSAFIIIISFTGFKKGEITLALILVAIIFIGQQVYERVTLADDVLSVSHIVGRIVGAIVGFYLIKKEV